MSSKSRARSHFENCLKLCVICKKNQKSLKKIQPAIISILESNSNYNSNDDRLPGAICVGCKFKVIKANKENNKQKLSVIVPSYIEFTSVRLLRSSSERKCDCTLCKLARDSGMYFNRNPNASVLLPETQQIVVNIHNTRSGGSKVYDDLKGRINNELTTKEREHLLSDLIKNTEKLKTAKTGKREISLSQTRGRSLRIALNPKNQEPKVAQISASDVAKIQTNYGITSNVMLGIARDFRVGSKKRKLFEPNLKQKLSVSNHTLDAFFSVQENEFVHIVGNKRTIVKQPFVFCSNIMQLCQFVQAKRESQVTHLKFGIDGGGGFLKLTLSIQDMRTDTYDTRRQRYTDGVAAATQENDENVRLLWSILKINELDRWTVATDLKLANILIGIMTHASNHPCTWCTALKGQLNECGEYRTFGDCVKNYDAWQETGAKRSNAKNFNNCINRPVLEGDDDDEVIDYIPPPELHLLIGIVNKLYDHMLVELPEITFKWTKACNVQRNIAYGNATFAGNACKTLLEKVDILRSFGRIDCLKYVQCFNDFKKVVASCFSKDLDENFETRIEQFRKSYCSLHISITPKVHAVFFHVPHFCRKFNTGLGFYSEQSVEAVHHDFKVTWDKYKVANEHPVYSSRLLKAVSEYNSRHV